MVPTERVAIVGALKCSREERTGQERRGRPRKIRIVAVEIDNEVCFRVWVMRDLQLLVQWI